MKLWRGYYKTLPTLSCVEQSEEGARQAKKYVDGLVAKVK